MYSFFLSYSFYSVTLKPINMARDNQALQPWKNYNDAQLDSDASDCINKIKAATAYASLAASATNAFDVHKAFSTSLEGARTGSRSLIAAKNALKEDLATTMNNLAVEVNSVAKGDLELLLQTNMPLNKPNGSPLPQQKPAGVSVSNGLNSGDAIVKVMEAVGAKSLIYQYTFDPITTNSVWTSKGSTRKTYTFTGLPAGTKVWFRVVSVGRNDAEIMSDVVGVFVI